MAANGVLEALRKACPTEPAAARDAVDGTAPAYVSAPGTVDEAAAVMAAAGEHGLRVLSRGAGTQVDWGAPLRGCDLVVSTEALTGVLEHAAGDLICRVQAGVTLRRLQDALAPAGQQLALDEPAPGATVGGALATAASGPRRLRFGTPRDLLIGVTVVLADGTVARSGGKVVKNVAGYDLGKLYTGSYGTLGLVVEATFRLHPLAPQRGFVTWAAPDSGTAYEGVRAVVGSQLAPTAVEVDRPGPAEPVTVGVLLEGDSRGVAERSAAAARMLGEDAGVSDAAPSWWTPPHQGVRIKLTSEMAALPALLDAVDAAGAKAGLSPSVRGSAGAGVLYAGLPADCEPATVGDFLGHLRGDVAGCGGTALVQSAPAAVRAAVDVWGPVQGLALMRAVKDRFDPDHRMAPGRFVGGI